VSAHRLTATALDRMSRRVRVRAIWAALSPAARERALAALDEDQRVEATAILLGAREERPRPQRQTFAGGYDAWQRRADR
jgi:hypothetical protein